jgi:hypothetical protein
MSALDFLSMSGRNCRQSGAETLLNHASASAKKVDNQNYQGDYQQQVDESSADVKAEAQKP